MKAKQMTPINPKALGASKEFSTVMVDTPLTCTVPKKLDASGQMIDGPYGGKKKQS